MIKKIIKISIITVVTIFVAMMLFSIIRYAFFLTPEERDEITQKNEIQRELREKERIAREEAVRVEDALEDQRNKEAKEKKDIEEKENLAGVCSRTCIADQLAPRSTNFPNTKKATYEKERNVYRINNIVDTENIFGGKERMRYYCEMNNVNLSTYTCDCKCSFE